MFFEKKKEILDLKLFAMMKALNITKKEKSDTDFTFLTIFSSSEKGLTVIRRSYFQKENQIL